MESFGKSNKGLIREKNEDTIYFSLESIGRLENLFVVADGMGGHKSGEIASQKAIDFFEEYIKLNEINQEDIEEIIISGISFSNNKILALSTMSDEYKGMGTTISLCSVENNRLHVGHVGDSRIYIIRETMEQITLDHTYVNEMVKLGEITEDEAKVHPKRSYITRALGIDDMVMVDYFVRYVKEEDIILLCSDGLTNMVNEDKIFEIIKKDSSLESKVNELINEALINGGRDNISAVLIRI